MMPTVSSQMRGGAGSQPATTAVQAAKSMPATVLGSESLISVHVRMVGTQIGYRFSFGCYLLTGVLLGAEPFHTYIPTSGMSQ